MGQTGYTRTLSESERLNVRFLTKFGKVVSFAIQCEVLIDGVWTPAIRFDNSHGSKPHRHTFYLHKPEHRIELTDDPGHILTTSKKFLEGNYQKIRANFLNN